MKKTLLATSSLALVFAGSAASAAEWETGVSGYYFLGVGITDSGAQDGLGVLRDGEAHVNGRLTADNGLTFRARIELEAFTSGDQIDENWGSVSGYFGTLMIGSNDTAVYENLSGIGIIIAPGTRIGYADAFSLTTAAMVSDSPFPGIASDQIGVHYTTPSFFGLTAFGSYHPSSTSDGAGDTNNPVFDSGTEIWNVGAAFEGDFGDFSLGLGMGYGDIEGVSGEQLSFAANVRFAAFTLAGFYEDEFAGSEFAIGAQYQTGPWTVAGGYGYGSDSATNNQIVSGWVTYTAAPGVLFTAGLEYADDDTTNNTDFGGLAFMTLRF